jgi:hypothetical protein
MTSLIAEVVMGTALYIKYATHIGHEDSVSMSVCKVHISATRWRIYT